MKKIWNAILEFDSEMDRRVSSTVESHGWIEVLKVQLALIVAALVMPLYAARVALASLCESKTSNE